MYKARRLVIFTFMDRPAGRVGRVTPFPGQVESGRKIWTRVQLCVNRL